MHRSLLPITLVLLLAAPVATTAPAKPPAVSGELIVKFKREAGYLVQPEAAAARFKCLEVRSLFPEALGRALSDVVASSGLDRVAVLKFSSDSELHDAVSQLMASGLVEYAEPNYLVYPGARDDSDLPNDPGFAEQWGLRNPGLAVGGFPATLDADIRALQAWSITTGSPDVLIAVTDTGVDIAHPDLAPNVYTNTREVEGNGQDDDGNGFVDDVNGYNVADRNGDVSDVLGHGTQMAGIIAGITNNRIGISGLSQSKILPVRFFKRTGPNPSDVEGTIADAARAIIYSIAAGASVINASWSTSATRRVPEESVALLRDAVQTANEAGVLMVCIAGNEGANIDSNPVYPASFQLPNQIVVAASDFNDDIWHLYGDPSALKTNYGVRTVQLAAPGLLVFTTAARGSCPLCSPSDEPDDWYAYVDGSSAAAAFASGVAALIKSLDPNSNMILTRRRILEAADVRDQLRSYVASSGRLNAFGALSVELSVSQPRLTKIKYKAGSEKMIILGEGMEKGAVVIVGGRSFPTRAKGDDPARFTATVPATRLPAGTAVEIRLLNPDGGMSPPLSYTR